MMQSNPGNYKISHFFLVEADDDVAASQQVKHYLEGNQLVTYADLVIRQNEIINGIDDRFNPAVENGIIKNMQFAQSMLIKLKNENVETLDDLLTIQQGYLTKVLHTLAHLVDGFIGVDTVFYNLVEDSHQVSEKLLELIEKEGQQYWLVPVRTGMLETSVLHL